MERKCQECGSGLRGRSDQKFCSSDCRSAFHNRRRQQQSAFFREINCALAKNRRLLLKLNPDGKTTVGLEQLRTAGFDFHYFTHTYRTRSGRIYYFCYDQGYTRLAGNKILLVVQQCYMGSNKKADV